MKVAPAPLSRLSPAPPPHALAHKPAIPSQISQDPRGMVLSPYLNDSQMAKIETGHTGGVFSGRNVW
jgi:hypothetical protein